MGDNKIENTYRFDHLSMENRIEDEPFGLFIQLHRSENGIRFNIDSSGQNIEYEIQSIDSFLDFAESFSMDIEKIGNDSVLFKLIGRSIKRIQIASINEKIVQGLGFVSTDRDIIAIQLISDCVLTFFNDGDEGKISFDIPESQLRFLFDDIKWHNLYLPGLLF